MLLHTPSLLVAFALILVLASAASVSVGLKQQSRRGARWWVVANAVLAAALTLQAGADPTAIGAPIAAVLALQWPIVMLGENVTNWQGLMRTGQLGAARSSCNSAPYTARR